MSQPRFAFAKIKIATKLWFGIGIIFCCSALAIGAMWLGMRHIQSRFASFIERDQTLAESYSGMYAQGLQMGQALRNIILDPSNPKAYDNLEQARKDFSALMGQGRWCIKKQWAGFPFPHFLRTQRPRPCRPW